jgi:hypothetical protein
MKKMTDFAAARWLANDEWLGGFKLSDRVKKAILERFDAEMLGAVSNATENIRAMLEAPWGAVEQIGECLVVAGEEN